MNALKITDVFIKNPDVVFRQIGNESLLIPIVNNVGDLSSIYNLNETGTRILELIDGERNVKEISALISEEYDVPMDAALRDACEFIGDMVDVKFLKRMYDKKH